MSESNRAQIAEEILAAVDAASRPITLAEMYDDCPSAEDRASVARVVSYLKSTGKIACAGEVQPGEPGGMSGKGARVVSAYQRVPEEPEKMTADSAWLQNAAEQFRRVDMYSPIRAMTERELLTEKLSRSEPIMRGTEEWDPDAARSVPRQEGVDEDDLVTLIHGHEELMLAYANDQLEGDKVWALMRQQYQAMQEL
jgi:hypothetical protein